MDDLEGEGREEYAADGGETAVRVGPAEDGDDDDEQHVGGTVVRRGRGVSCDEHDTREGAEESGEQVGAQQDSGGTNSGESGSRPVGSFEGEGQSQRGAVEDESDEEGDESEDDEEEGNSCDCGLAERRQRFGGSVEGFAMVPSVARIGVTPT